MKKYIEICLLTSIILLSMTGCNRSEQVKLDPKNPVMVEVWHYYSGSQRNAFSDMVEEFNSTVGTEKGIIVQEINQGDIGELSGKVIDTANQKVGTGEMPAIFQGYASSVYELDQMGVLANLDEYFSEEELSEYIPSYIEEGRMGEKNQLKIFPVAKSTEILMINKTDWEKFAESTGMDIETMATIEGVAEAAEKYYEWSDGKALFGRDAVANYFLVGAMQQGKELFEVKNGTVTFQLDKQVMKKLWDYYYVPYIKGYFGAYGKFRSDDTKVGDILAFVGSTTASTYFPKEVFRENNIEYPIEAIVMQAPVFASEKPVAVQQGAGMAVGKSTKEKEYASAEFLKWFTDTERNMEFAVSSGYLPVKKEAATKEQLEKYLDAVNGDIDPLLVETLKVAFELPEKENFYTVGAFPNGNAARDILEYNLTEKAQEDHEEILNLIKQGEVRASAIAQYDTEEAFGKWLKELQAELEETQK